MEWTVRSMKRCFDRGSETALQVCMYMCVVTNLKGKYQPSAPGSLHKELASKEYKGNENGRLFRGEKLKDLSPLINRNWRCRRNGRSGSKKRRNTT